MLLRFGRQQGSEFRQRGLSLARDRLVERGIKSIDLAKDPLKSSLIWSSASLVPDRIAAVVPASRSCGPDRRGGGAGRTMRSRRSSSINNLRTSRRAGASPLMAASNMRLQVTATLVSFVLRPSFRTETSCVRPSLKLCQPSSSSWLLRLPEGLPLWPSAQRAPTGGLP